MKSKKLVLIIVSFISISLVVSLTTIFLTLNQDHEKTQFIHIKSDKDFANYNFPGSGTKNDPFIIEGYELGFETRDIKDYSALLLISNVTKHVIIRNNLLNGSHIGIAIVGSKQSSVLIENNYFKAQKQCINSICFNSFYGIKIYDSSNVTIRNNEFQESNYDGYIYGIFFERSENIEILDNVVSSFYAIYGFDSYSFNISGNYYYESVDIYFEQCSYFNVKNNIHDYLFRFKLRYSSLMLFEKNTIMGYGTGFGLIFEFSTDMIISNNTFDENYNGISIIDSHWIDIIDNTFQFNVNYSIEILGYSSNHEIYLNKFIDNNLNFNGLAQALDNGYDNSWSNEVLELGNAWSDIGTSSVYYIDGTADSIDYSPLVE